MESSLCSNAPDNDRVSGDVEILPCTEYEEATPDSVLDVVDEVLQRTMVWRCMDFSRVSVS